MGVSQLETLDVEGLQVSVSTWTDIGSVVGVVVRLEGVELSKAVGINRGYTITEAVAEAREVLARLANHVIPPVEVS